MIREQRVRCRERETNANFVVLFVRANMYMEMCSNNKTRTQAHTANRLLIRWSQPDHLSHDCTLLHVSFDDADRRTNRVVCGRFSVEFKQLRSSEIAPHVYRYVTADSGTLMRASNQIVKCQMSNIKTKQNQNVSDEFAKEILHVRE